MMNGVQIVVEIQQRKQWAGLDYHGALRRRLMEIWYIWRHVMRMNPLAAPGLIRTMVSYKSGRGMSFLTDARDWLGGWPMEFAKDRDVIKYFIEEQCCTLENLTTGQANTEFLFRKSDQGPSRRQRTVTDPPPPA